MNTPGVADGNWAWRIGAPGVFASATGEAKRLAALAERYQRVASTGPQALRKKTEVAAEPVAPEPTPAPEAAAPEEKKKFLGIF
jgi:4-alpha-glucanotransferase